MPPLDAFVGRDGELATLRSVLDRAAAGEASAALVAGDAGMGKTRLLAEVVAGARDRNGGRRVLRGDAVAGDATAFGLWIGVERGLGVAAAAGDTSLPASERRWEVLESLEAGLRAAGPSVVVLEDLHWADDASLWVLERLPRQLDGAPVAILATTRLDEPGVERVDGFRRQATTVELPGLDGAAVGRLVDALRPGSDIDRDALRTRTGGNPLFVHELLVSAEGRMPAAVSGVLARSLDRLDEPTRAAAGLLAVAGPGTPLAVLAAAGGLDPLALRDRLDAAVAADVLRRDGQQVGFRHVLLAEAAAADRSAADRSAIHLRLADAWVEVVDGTAARARAVGHRLAALPLGDPRAVVGEALDVVAALAAEGEQRQVLDLARSALAALEGAGLAAVDERLALTMALAAALDAVGDEPGAIETFTIAADLARDGGADLEVRARAEIGACAAVHPFLPHVEGLARLREVAAALPPGDSPLRVGLLRRASVLQCSSPGGPRAAVAEGEAAVAMARRLGDPELLVQAIADRHFIPLGIDGLEAKAEAAEEVRTLGERLGRPDLALRGYEWMFADHLDRGDLVGAQAALTRFEAYAEVMPSPWWRWAAALRRVVMANAHADHPGALAATDRAMAIGMGVADPGEVFGLDLSCRVGTALLWGIEDPLVRPRHDQMVAMVGDLGAPFLDVMLGLNHWALGELDRTAVLVDRHARNAEALLEGVEGAPMVAYLASMVAEVGAADHAPALRALLAPYATRLGCGNGTGCFLPIAAVLGRLATTHGDVEGAVAHHRDGLAFAEAMVAPSLVARCAAYLADALAASGDDDGAVEARTKAESVAARIGLRLPAPASAIGGSVPVPVPASAIGGSASAIGGSAPGPFSASDTVSASAASGSGAGPAATVGPVAGGRNGSLRRDGEGWVVASPHGQGRVADAVGVLQLARLLAAPDQEVPATMLAGMDEVPGGPATDLGPALDARAKREYRRRIGELRADIDEAEANHDPDRATLAQLELDALLTELSNAVGLGGRDRPTGAGTERARVNVTRNVRRAIAAVAAVVPDLGAHLERSVRTGRYCVYAPEPTTALTWEITTES